MGIPQGLNTLVRAITAKVPLIQINTAAAPPP